ncbi:MAG: hypothetical protein KBE09_04320 [Candidatus Pacebacteria bacterium]|nr:hypothetical protein [Candidatus Paceibacterota bacterium]
MKERIRMRRATLVVQTAVNAYRARAYPYQNIQLPQNMLTPAILADARTAALILFYSCHYMRGTIKSDYAMRKIVELHAQFPDFFDPHRAMQLPFETVRERLYAMIPYKSGEITRSWIENSRRLALHWHSDPRTIFSVARSKSDLYRYVTNRTTVRLEDRTGNLNEDGFMGFQKKMANMLAYFLESCALVKPFPVETVPPVDFHHLRILIATQSIVVPDKTQARYEEVRPVGEHVYAVLMKRHNIGMLELGDALWLLSSRLCSESPVTETRDGELMGVDWDNPEVRSRYARTCGSCPLQQYCTIAVQANVYYQKGYFELTRVRPQPPKHAVRHDLFPDAPRVFPRKGA